MEGFGRVFCKGLWAPAWCPNPEMFSIHPFEVAGLARKRGRLPHKGMPHFLFTELVPQNNFLPWTMTAPRFFCSISTAPDPRFSLRTGPGGFKAADRVRLQDAQVPLGDHGKGGAAAECACCGRQRHVEGPIFAVGVFHLAWKS